MVQTRILLAPVLVSLRRHTDATMGLKEAEEMLAEHGDAGNLREWHEEAVQYLHLPARRAPPSAALSDAERKVLRLLASDLSVREIGRELYLSTNTVKTHVHSIYRKLGVSPHTNAIRAARTQGRAQRADAPG
jgi:LuxR family transcriptional regulator, maltose regulon positive regulatory protein